MLGRTNTGGGGSGGLNFQVIGGTTVPNNPKENTIWVNTSTKITDWVFSATQPAAQAGRVWIATGTSSSIEFNALKKNGIQVYPISAKQYVSGAWVDVEAKSYQGGKWVDWWDGTLFKNGDQYTAVTGGWKVLGSNCNITQKAIEFECKNNYSVASSHTKNIMDLKPFSKIKARIYITEKNEYPFSIGITKKLDNNCTNYAIARTDTNETGNIELECDIASIDSGYPFVTSNEVNVAVKEIRFER